jgi:hypothetical protein
MIAMQRAFSHFDWMTDQRWLRGSSTHAFVLCNIGEKKWFNAERNQGACKHECFGQRLNPAAEKRLNRSKVK